MRLFAAGFLAAGWLLAQSGKSALSRIAVEGNAEFSADAVAAETGLAAGAAVTTADFDAGCSRLMATGMFFTCRYRWESIGPNVSVTFQVGEQRAAQPFRIDIPGLDEAKLAAWARDEHLLFREKIPASDAASAYYVRAIERYLTAQNATDKIIAKTEADLNTNEVTYVFRPAKLPRIAEIRFIGNIEISSDRLLAVLSKAAVGAEYSNAVFRRMLEFYVTRVYEELGRLDVKFTKIEMQKSGDNAVVITTIEEGPAFQLAAVDVKVDGAATLADGFPVGRIANWRAVRDVADKLIRAQRNEGYLSADAKIGRTLDRVKQTVVASVDVERGPRYVFGNVSVKGLEPAVLAKAMEHWDLKSGAPMRERYPADFIDRVFRLAGVGPTVRSAGAHFEFRPNTNVVDVTVTFR